MMQVKSLLSNILQTGMPIDEAVTTVNQQIYNNNKENYFVTALIVSINLSTGDISYVNAGHNYPLIKRSNEFFEYFVPQRNIVLGIMDGYKYKRTDSKLNKDDLLFLYTDGVTEAMNPENEQYGDERLKNVLNDIKNNPPEEILKKLNADIADFGKNAEQTDDITTLIFKYNG